MSDLSINFFAGLERKDLMKAFRKYIKKYSLKETDE